MSNRENDGDDKNNNMKFKISIMVIYNTMIAIFIAYTNWNDWGAIVAGLMLEFTIVVITPLIAWLVFRKNKKTLLFVLGSLAVTILVAFGTRFFMNPNNIRNIIKNNEDQRMVVEIKNSKEYILFSQNAQYSTYIDLTNKKVYVLENKKIGGGGNDMIERNNLLMIKDFVKLDHMTNAQFNEFLVSTQKVSNSHVSATINMRYKNVNPQNIEFQMLIQMEDGYYTVNNFYDVFYDEYLENHIIQKKLFVIGNNEMENNPVDEQPQKNAFEIFSDEQFGVFIFKNYYNEFRYNIEMIYKCNIDNKDDNMRLAEYRKATKKDDFIPNGLKKNVYQVNNSLVSKVIIYDFGNKVAWLEIFPINTDYSVFTRFDNMPSLESRVVK